MTHKQRAKKYFKDLHLHVYYYFGPSSQKEIDNMFHHLFEAIKTEIKQDLMAGITGKIIDTRVK